MRRRTTFVSWDEVDPSPRPVSFLLTHLFSNSSECWGNSGGPAMRKQPSPYLCPLQPPHPRPSFYPERTGQAVSSCTHRVQTARHTAPSTLGNWQDIHLDSAFWAGRNYWGILCFRGASRLSVKPETAHLLVFQGCTVGRCLPVVLTHGKMLKHFQSFLNILSNLSF